MLLIKAVAKPSAIHGLGCFAAQDVPEGQVVWEFHPQVDRRYTVAEFAQLPSEVRDFFRTYAWLNPVDNHVLFCGDHSKFFNHSDCANTTMSPDGYRCVANRDIAAGEELTSDYEQLKEVPQP